jgi:glycosyltransferase involved in cell wall biosynthesis
MNNSKKNRILFIATSPLYLEKGSSLRTYAILKILSEYYKIDLVTYSIGKEFSLNNVTVYRTPQWFKPRLSIGVPTVSKLFLDILVWMNAFRLSLIKKYDVIHCEDFEGLAIGCAIRPFNKKSKIIYDLHNRILDNLHLKKEQSRLDAVLLILENNFVKKTDTIILNWAKYLKDDLFAGKKKFLYYDTLKTKVTAIKLPAANYLIYSGNFEDYQGLQYFIPIFSKIKHDIKLVLVGNPSVKIKKIIKDLNAENKILLTGRLPVEQTNYLIKNSIAGVLPRLQGSSMKVIHYFLWNKPVIAPNTRSNRELIIDGVNGFLYHSEIELEKRLKTIIFHKEITEGFSEGIKNTKDIILNTWNKKRFISEYIK